MFKWDFQTQYHTANLSYHTPPYHIISLINLSFAWWWVFKKLQMVGGFIIREQCFGLSFVVKVPLVQFWKLDVMWKALLCSSRFVPYPDHKCLWFTFRLDGCHWLSNLISTRLLHSMKKCSNISFFSSTFTSLNKKSSMSSPAESATY